MRLGRWLARCRAEACRQRMTVQTPCGFIKGGQLCAVPAGACSQIPLSRRHDRYKCLGKSVSFEATPQMATLQPETKEIAAPPSAHTQARILAEALPHMQRYDRQTVVV